MTFYSDPALAYCVVIDTGQYFKNDRHKADFFFLFTNYKRPTTRDQEGNFGVFKSPKKQTKLFEDSALKWVKSIK